MNELYPGFLVRIKCINYPLLHVLAYQNHRQEDRKGVSLKVEYSLKSDYKIRETKWVFSGMTLGIHVKIV
jgi:hypothetical protein